MEESAGNEGEFQASPLVVARIEQIERDVRAKLAKPIAFKFDPSGKHLFSMMELRQSYAKRCVDFSDSIRSLLAADRTVPATVISRALIETIAMACLYLHDMKRLIAAGDHDRLNERLFRFYSGVKGGPVEPVHVMDAVRYLERIDKDYVSYLDKKFGLIAKMMEMSKSQGEEASIDSVLNSISTTNVYNRLSEVSHPNGLGTQFLYPDGSNEDAAVTEMRERFRTASIAAIWQCHHLLRALDDSEDLPERYEAAFMRDQ